VTFPSLSYLSFSVLPLLPTHFRRRGFLLHVITLSDTNTLGKTPLDEGSSLGSDFFLTTHNVHNRQTFMPLVGFEPAIPARWRWQITPKITPQLRSVTFTIWPLHYRLYGKVPSFGKKVLPVRDTVQILSDAMLSRKHVAVTWRETILMHFITYSTEQFKKLQSRNCKKNKRMINWEGSGYRRSLSTSNYYSSLNRQTEKPQGKSRST